MSRRLRGAPPDGKLLHMFAGALVDTSTDVVITGIDSMKVLDQAL